MTVEQLGKAVRDVFEKHHDKLDDRLPFFYSFPLNCCQGASVVFGLLVVDLLGKQNVTVIKGTTRNRQVSHYWLEIDELVYDLTLDQFKDSLGGRFEGIDSPLYGAEKHPLRLHFFYKERVSVSLAFSIFCRRHANLKDVDGSLQFVRREVLNICIPEEGASPRDLFAPSLGNCW
jgi:hypothetical protein